MRYGLRILSLRKVLRSGQYEEIDFSEAPVTALVGVGNTSKSTTLKIIDYCLGSKDSPVGALTEPVADAYQAFELEVAVNGEEHTLRRSLLRGTIGQVEVDSANKDAAEFSSWLLGELDWPIIDIPMAKDASYARNLVPLTFRSLIRHIYRDEASWLSFADKEQEYLRRAVISLFLGVAELRYDNIEYHVSRAQAAVNEKSAALATARGSADHATRDLMRQLGIPVEIGSDNLSAARGLIQAELSRKHEQRRRLFSAMRGEIEASEDFSSEGQALEAEFTSLEARRRDLSAVIQTLQAALDEHDLSRRTVDGEMDRLDRLIVAFDALTDIPVRACPACTQSITPVDSEGDRCYVCHQEVTADLRTRRAEAEKRALAAEALDLDDVRRGLRAQIDEVRAQLGDCTRRQAEVASILDDSRRTTIAPVIAEIEDIAAGIANLESQLQTLPAIEAMYDRLGGLVDETIEAEQELSRLLRLMDERSTPDAIVRERANAIAVRMNEFLSEFDDSTVWTSRRVTITEQLSFRVGNRDWEDQLGGGARVLFFLAYCYALLWLSEDLSEDGCPPGFLMIDNPYQQDVPPSEVDRALSLLVRAASGSGAQLIVAQSREWEAVVEGVKIQRLTTVYAGAGRTVTSDVDEDLR